MASSANSPRRHGTFFPLMAMLLAAALNIVLIYLFVALARTVIWALVHPGEFELIRIWDPELFGWVAAVAGGLIVLGSVYKVIAFWGGGPQVARLLRARMIDPGKPGQDPYETRFVQTLGELANAAGIPAPGACVIELGSVNAFVAGHRPSDAVIGVTRGSLESLRPEELRAVLAHLVCLIRGGDIGLYMRLVCLLHGIMAPGMLGAGMMGAFNEDSVDPATAERYRTSGRAGGLASGFAALAFFSCLGFILVGLGCVGHNIGRMIRNALTRRRALQADAEAAALTGNPKALAGALCTIGGLREGSQIKNWRAEQVSHFFFCDAISPPGDTRKATHPALQDRIRRLDPGWNGEFTDLRVPPGRQVVLHIPVEDPFDKPLDPSAAPGAAPAGAERPKAGPAKSRTTPAESYAQAWARLGQRITEAHKTQAHRPLGTQGMLYALTLPGPGPQRDDQLRLLIPKLDPAIANELREAIRLIDPLTPEERLPLIDIIAEAVPKIVKFQRMPFLENLKQLIRADRRVEPVELLFHRMALHRLELTLEVPTATRRGDEAPFKKHAAQVEVVLSAIAHAGSDTIPQASLGLAAGEARLGAGDIGLQLLPPERCELKDFDKALGELQLALGPLEKRVLLEACMACVARDRVVDLDEAVLIRLAAEILESRVAPILPGQTLD